MKLYKSARPADPLALALIPSAPPVEKEKSLAPIRGVSMAAVQLRDSVDGRGQQFVVSRHVFLRRVRPVGEEREAKIAIWIRQVVHFQTLDLLGNLSGADQKSRDDNQGAQIRWDAIAEREPGQHPWAKQFCHLTIDQRNCQIRSRNESEKRNKQQSRNTNFCCARIEQEQSQDQTADDRNRCKVPRRCISHVGAAQPGLDRHAKAELLLKGNPAVRDKIVAGIRAAVCGGLTSL